MQIQFCFCLQFSPLLKRIGKVIRESAFKQKKMKRRLKFIPGVELIGLRTTGPWMLKLTLVKLLNGLLRCIRGCLHDTGATFAPRRVHSGSLSWLYIGLHDTITKCHAGASRPGVSSLRLSHRGEISQRYHVNAKRPPVPVGNRSAGRLERVAHA